MGYTKTDWIVSALNRTTDKDDIISNIKQVPEKYRYIETEQTMLEDRIGTWNIMSKWAMAEYRRDILSREGGHDAI